MSDFDNPGSKAAGLKGCTCPVWDNHNGQGYRGQPNVFVILEGCPLHADRNSPLFQEIKTSASEGTT